MAGQYVQVFIPVTEWMSPAYSIGNAPREEVGIELQIRKVKAGRFFMWGFGKMKVGDVIKVHENASGLIRSADDRTLWTIN